MEPARAIERHPGNHEILVDDRAHARDTVLFQQVRKTAHLMAEQRSRGRLAPYRSEPSLPLLPQVVLGPAGLFRIGLPVARRRRRGSYPARLRIRGHGWSL